MIYLYLGNKTIKLLSLSKTMLGQYNTSFFQKTHEADILKNGQINNIDLAASAIKEALTSAHPESVSDKCIFLILPQESYEFIRYDIPSDISENAIAPFVKDKIRADMKFDIGDSMYDFIVCHQQKECKVNFFALKKDQYKKFEEVFSILGLVVKNIVPETICYFKLFEKTLREEKKEHILYLRYENGISSGYLYDSLGLLEGKKYTYGDDVKKKIREDVEKLQSKGTKIDRLILSGEESKKVRQDLFTKDVGIWTNPLEKIIQNFYKDYLRLILPAKEEKFSFLQFDACFGGFVFDLEKDTFSLLSEKERASDTQERRLSLPSFSFPISLSKKDLGIFAISFVVSLIIILGISNASKIKGISLPQIKKEQPTPKPTIKPTNTPTPTPSIARKDVNIKILNGVGTKGKAGEVADILKEAGYTEVLTDNADNYDYELTELQVKSEKKGITGIIKKDLEDYVAIEKTTTLEKDESADVILIIGADFGD